MISYAEEYEKVYSYKCRHKIYENPLHPSNLNMNLMTHFNENNQRKHYKTDNNFYKNENFKDFYRSRAIFSAYLKQRYKKRDDRGVSENLQNMEKANKFYFLLKNLNNFSYFVKIFFYRSFLKKFHSKLQRFFLNSFK